MTTLYPSAWKALTTSHTEPVKNFQSSAPTGNDAPLLVSVRVPSCRGRVGVRVRVLDSHPRMRFYMRTHGCNDDCTTAASRWYHSGVTAATLQNCRVGTTGVWWQHRVTVVRDAAAVCVSGIAGGDCWRHAHQVERRNLGCCSSRLFDPAACPGFSRRRCMTTWCTSNMGMW